MVFGFGKELPYSKKEYDEASDRATDASDWWYKQKNRYGGDPSNVPLHDLGEYIMSEHDADSTRKRLKKIKEKGEKEATILNAEYDNLLSKAQKAIAELVVFEQEKLGMEKKEDTAESE